MVFVNAWKGYWINNLEKCMGCCNPNFVGLSCESILLHTQEIKDNRRGRIVMNHSKKQIVRGRGALRFTASGSCLWGPAEKSRHAYQQPGVLNGLCKKALHVLLS